MAWPERTLRRRALRAGAIFAVLSSLCSVASPAAAEQPAPQPAAPVRIPLAEYFRGLKTAEVTIGGRRYAFLVDTGGGRTLVTPTVAAAIGCRPYGHDVGYRMTGEVVAFQNCPALAASVASFRLRLSPVAVFDIGALLPKELRPLDGVLALDAFRAQVVTIDWAGGVLTVHSSRESNRAVRERGVPVRFATGENGASLTALLPVRATGGYHLWFLLDSGNIRGTLVGRHLRNEGALSFPLDSTASIAIGTGAPRSYDVSVADINYDGVLGTAFLGSNVVTMDLRKAPPASVR